MLKYKNLVIIGTSHISEQSIKEIERTFHKEKPDIIAVELDKTRLIALMENQKPDYSPKLIFKIGLKGYLFAVVGGIVQQKLGSIVGIKPGSDMLTAINLAKNHQKQISLIDQDVRKTLSKLSKNITFKEKINFLVDIITSPFKPKIKFDLKSVPDKKTIRKLMGFLKKRYPGVHKTIVEERNRVMAIKLHHIISNHQDKKILAIVGAGHEEEISNLIKTYINQ